MRPSKRLLVFAMPCLLASALLSVVPSPGRAESLRPEGSGGGIGGALETPGEEPAPPAGSAAGAVLWARYRGVIGTVSASYLLDALAEVERSGAACLVIELDTPGGLDTAMRDIIQGILASDTPVVCYVSPSGARAASAGAFIALASHVIAMAPGTNLGAAHPVSLGGEADSVMIAKATNDSAAYIRGLAKQRGRDPDWAERAVRESISADAEKALELGIADLLVASRDELLAELDGREVETPAGKRTLATEGAELREFEMSVRYRLLGLLNDPNVAYLLLLIGFYGIFFELSSPGAIFPGVIGGIAMILGLYSLQSLSINYAGLLLMLLGLIFFVAELKTPTHGVLTAGGIASLTLGSLMLFRSPMPFLRVSLQVILPAVIVTAAFFIFAITMALRAQKRRPSIGRRSLVGALGEARSDLSPRGSVFVAGAHWEAEAAGSVAAGAKVVVEEVDGLLLRVRAADPERKGE